MWQVVLMFVILPAYSKIPALLMAEWAVSFFFLPVKHEKK